jgi:hypothetical protein
MVKRAQSNLVSLALPDPHLLDTNYTMAERRRREDMRRKLMTLALVPIRLWEDKRKAEEHFHLLQLLPMVLMAYSLNPNNHTGLLNMGHQLDHL